MYLDDIVERLPILSVEGELPVPDLVDCTGLPRERLAPLDLAKVPFRVGPAAAHSVHLAALIASSTIVRGGYENGVE